MKKEDLQKILELHALWLFDKEGGVCADLSNKDLSFADLRYEDLRGANLCCANLSGADLCCVNLSSADLYGADLRGAKLYSTDLRDADLYGAYLRGADLRGGKLYSTDLCDADLYGADLRDADLRGAKLYSTDLRDADLYGADLRGADLRGAKYNLFTIGLRNLCPEGDFVGWKKVNKCLIKLLIPADAKRSNATTYRCRCEFAKVLDICKLDNEAEKTTEVINYNYVRTVYKVGEIVYADSWDEDRWNECSHGIHFFIDKEMAKDY